MAGAAAAAGIDVGDSASCIALARKGGVDVLLNQESKRESPSIVTFSASQRLIGTAAVGALSTNPRNTVSQVKRLLGKRFSDPAVQADLQYFPFIVVEGPGGECLVEVAYLGKPTRLSPEQLMAMLLVDLRGIAEREHGAHVNDAVLAVPVYFTEPERHAMLAAAQIAGLNCLRLLNETTATSLAYGIYKTDLPEETQVHVAFLDIGFASTQVCVVALKKGHLKVLSNAWDRNLGGRDFDNVLFEHFVKEFGEKYKLDIKSNARASYRLRLACEKLKKVLTTNPEAPINVECLMNDMDVHSVMTRETFEAESKPILDRLLVPIQRAVEQAGLTPEAIYGVEVVGGCSRVPAVATLIRNYFDKEPSRTLNAKETVARGCALQCAMLSPAFKVRDFHVQDSFPYGVQFTWAKEEGSITSVVFERGSCVPSAKMPTFYRSEPFDITAEYTPDSDIPPTANRFIGCWRVGPFKLPASAERAKLKVKVSLNLNGVVAVESAQLVEEEEYEEELPVEATAMMQPGAADQPTADAAAADTSEDQANAAEEGASSVTETQAATKAAGVPMEQDAAVAPPTEQPATQKVMKRRVRKHNVPFSSSTTAISSEHLQTLYEAECEMALQARVQEETNDAKNALEAYIYSLRNRLHNRLAPYVQEEYKSSLLTKLDEEENWLYDEDGGENATKSVYQSRLADLQKLGQPIEFRAKEGAARPAAVAALRSAVEQIAQETQSTDSKYAHIDAADKQKVLAEAQAVKQWLREKEGVQAAQQKYNDPVLLSADITKKREVLERVAEVLKTPPPLVNEESKLAKEAPDAEAGQMEMEGAAGPQHEQPMDADS